ncbi:MAG: 4Fe-4S double cluster binding domain-containing protein [Acidobacteriota bacterium]
MNNREIEKIKQKIIEWGATLIGFGDLRDCIPWKLRHLRNAVSIAVRLPDSIIDEIVRGPTMEYAYHYHVVNALLNEIAIKTTNLIQSLDYKAFPVPASQTLDREKLEALFPHKTAATRAGLGWIGKNALLVTPEFGPRVRLVTVLTDYPFELGSPFEDTQCKNCVRCVEICPVKAIKGNVWKIGVERDELVDVYTCNKLIEENKKIFNAPVCGQCISVCPVGIN